MPIKTGRLAYRKVYTLVRHFCADVDATKTALLTGANRNTVNRYYNIFRERVYERQMADLEKFFGVVEVDEAYFGAKRLRGVNMPQKRGRGTWKLMVFGVFERDGRVYTEVIPSAKAEHLRRVITGKVSVESVVISDGWRGYSGLVDIGYDKHLRIDKSRHFSDGKGTHINGIESFWSFTKRTLAKFNGVKPKFHLHLKECEWRWKKTNAELVAELTGMLKYGKRTARHKKA